MTDMQAHSWVHTQVVDEAPAVLVHCRRAAGMLGRISRGSNCFCWAGPRVRAAPQDFKEPRQCVLEKMRSSASTSQQSVIGGDCGEAPRGHCVVLTGQGVMQH